MKNTQPKKQKNQDTKIFICSHKNFSCKVKNEHLYKIIYDGKIKVKDAGKIKHVKEDNELTPMQHCYNEITRQYEVYLKHTKSILYVGFCHYRRYFNFADNPPEFSNIMAKYDIILPQKISVKNVREQYASFHRVQDLFDMFDIVQERHPDYKDAIDNTLNDSTLYCWNIFVMPVSKFREWIEFCIPIFRQFAEARQWKTDADVKKYVEEHLNEYGLNVNYQTRVFGFLSERLFNCWIKKNIEPSKIGQTKVNEYLSM